MKITFLSASVPLTKTITLTKDGEIKKDAYPLVNTFTSDEIEVATIEDFHKVLFKAATSARKPCLLKGKLTRPLNNESRKGTTQTNDATEYVCLDLDRASFSTPEEVMRALGLDDISYVVQYSASYKLDRKDKKLSCHIFFMLDKPKPAPQLKAWLMWLNQTVAPLERDLELCKSAAALHWPLDISTCQNDKLIYIAVPTFKNMMSPLKEADRIQLVKKDKGKLPVSRLTIKPIEQLKTKARDKLNALRAEAGIKALRAPKMVGEYEVQTGIGEVINYEVFDCGEYNRLNLNGGDSQAYWHPKSDPTYLHNFKGEPSVLMKEVLPHYYADIIRNQAASAAAPTADGIKVLAFRDKVTAAYWKGHFDPATQDLEIYTVKSELQLDHFLQAHGKSLGPFVPEFHLTFDPHNPVIFDEAAKTINTFVPTEYMRLMKKNTAGKYPIIQRVLDSCVGKGEVQEHFLNWLAVVWQQRRKPLTAWVLHGTEGCLAGETEIVFRRGKRNAGRALPIKEAFEKWTGQYKQGTGRGKAWDMSIPTYAHCVKDGQTVGYSEVYRIVESGVKKLYRVLAEDGSLIRVTHEHPFMREDGSFTKLCELKPGDVVLMRGEKNSHAKPVGRSKGRAVIHSVPHHPHGWQHMINGKNYKRIHRARAVWEAAMNGLELKEFVHILRHDPKSAMMLRYLDPSIVVHHLDEDCSNDALENLTTVSKENHDQFHAKHTGLGTVPTVARRILNITEDGEEMTYDMTMKAPYHNYVANGFCVSNTGKGLLFHNVLAPLLGRQHAVQKRASELNGDFNGWIERALICMIDEIDADMFTNARSVEANLRTMITEPTVSIRKMRTDSYEVPNYTAFIFSSNKKRPAAIPPGDRRFNVAQFQAEKLIITPKEVAGIADELSAFAHMLSSREACFEKARTVLNTADRQAVQRLSITSVDSLAADILDGKFMTLWEAMPDEALAEANGMIDPVAMAYAQLMRRMSTETESRISRDELMLIFRYCIGKVPEGARKQTAWLEHHGVVLNRLRVGTGRSYGLDITWKMTPEERRSVRAELDGKAKPARMKRVK